MEGPRPYNPDGLAVSDPLRDRAQWVAAQAGVKLGTLAARIFLALFRKAAGKPATIETSLRELRDDPHCGAGSDSGVRKALKALQVRGLIDVPHKRLSGRFAIGVRVAAPASPQMLLPEIAASRPASPALQLRAGPEAEARAPQQCAPVVRTDGAPAVAGKSSSPQTHDGPAIYAEVAAKLQSRFDSMARDSLERSERSERPNKYIDVLERSERSEAETAQRCAPLVRTDGAPATAGKSSSSQTHRFAGYLRAITRRLGPNVTHDWMPAAVAAFAQVGALSENQLHTALETCDNWRAFTSAIRWQTAKTVAERLERAGVLDDAAKAALHEAERANGEKRFELFANVIQALPRDEVEAASKELRALDAWANHRPRMPQFKPLRALIEKMGHELPPRLKRRPK